MELSEDRVSSAVTYNRDRGYSPELIARIQTLVEVSEAGLGPETARAVAAWQASEGLTVDGKIGPSTLDDMYVAIQASECGDDEDAGECREDHDNADTTDEADPEHGADPLAGLTCVDLRRVKRSKKRGKPKGRRPWKQITGITLHQTSVVFGSPTHRAIPNIPAHAMTFADGQVVLLNPPTALMYHGNGFNRRDIGIEIDCHACGIEGVYNERIGARGDNTFWRPESRPSCPPVEVTDAQIAATKALIRYYIELVAAKGGKIEYVHAHRQSANKLSDPGSKIWKELGIWAQEEFGLSTETTGSNLRGKGHPIPTAWDPRIEGVPYSRRFKGYEDHE